MSKSVCSGRKKRGGKGYRLLARARARGRDSQIKIRAVVSSRRLEMRVGADNVGNCPNVIVIDARSARASARRQRKLN